MRYYIIFGITIVLSLFILFYNPNKDALGVYKDTFTIDYTSMNQNCTWNVTISDNNLELSSSSLNKWTFIRKNVGESNIEAICIDPETKEEKQNIEYKFEVKKNNIIWKEGIAKGLLDFPNPY